MGWRHAHSVAPIDQQLQNAHAGRLRQTGSRAVGAASPLSVTFGWNGCMVTAVTETACAVSTKPISARSRRCRCGSKSPATMTAMRTATLSKIRRQTAARGLRPLPTHLHRASPARFQRFWALSKTLVSSLNTSPVARFTPYAAFRAFRIFQMRMEPLIPHVETVITGSTLRQQSLTTCWLICARFNLLGLRHGALMSAYLTQFSRSFVALGVWRSSQLYLDNAARTGEGAAASVGMA